ncbi:hypothetical protein [Trichocoleus sp. FACHB-262]|uniref:hypothetical protein n=1 Tax=Trichocoleus sp. FACHB-262 TaxID=2692869 RepID=UPI001683D396|nr:hypothetical protein [Trichocoleus sp. FACHB-262]MBD2124744.1 hypothetical protein [Trichocoleus sp. FACHB-262]
MTTIFFFRVHNDNGQSLLDRYVQPACNRLSLKLTVSQSGADRFDSFRASMSSDLVLWDGSVEPGHAYHAFSEIPKQRGSKHIIISRTSLPRNVLAYNQFAPIHGEAFTNEELGEWLDQYLSAILAGKRFTPSRAKNSTSSIASQYWMFSNAADVFLSFRGTQQKAAEIWSQEFATSSGLNVRMVPEAEYSYRTECVTHQQMWEGVARLGHEITSTNKAVVFLTDDYFDSFWTCSELLFLIDRRRNSDKSIQGAYVIPDKSRPDLAPLFIETSQLPIPSLTSTQSHRLFKILNNSDPLTVGPDTRISPSGPNKLLALVLRPIFGWYDPEFMEDSFWKTVRVPCPHCRPQNRFPGHIDWDRHLNLAACDPEVDYFGYFPTSSERLANKVVECPTCHNRIRLENKRPPRTL